MPGGFLLPLVALLLGATAAPLAADELPAKSRRAKELMAEGRFADAVPIYRELVKAVPNNPGLLANLGMALHLSGQDRDAVAPLEAALHLDPQSMPASLFLGASQLRLGRAAAAVAPLQKVVRLQPDNVEARSLLAEALIALDRYSAAEPHLRRITQAAPRDPAAWFNLGKAYEELASRTFAGLLERDPESSYTLALAADARVGQGQRSAAFRLYRQALERDPTLRGLHAAMAGIYRAAGHDDWAAVEEEKERRLPAPDCARNVLECAFRGGKHRDVVTAAAASKDPARVYWLVRAYGELAAEAFGRLTALPPSVHSHQWLAELHRHERRFAESADEWRKALALAPEDPELMTELAVTLRMNRDLAGAQKVLEDVLRAHPDAPGANHLMGDVLLAQDHPEQAIGYLVKAVRGAPDALPVHASLGRAYALAGQPAAAVPHLEKVLPADQDGSLRLQLARAYQAAGQAEKAQAALADYEAFRKGSQAAAEAAGQDATLPPPEDAGAPAPSPSPG
jgi:predicted Zn-dependent protease